jgi:WD40 repeat protein
MNGTNELLLQRCDKNALVGVVGDLCVVFNEYLERHVDYPEENDGELDCERVKTIIYIALLKMQVAKREQQEKDHNAFTVVLLGAGVVAGEPAFQVAEAGQEGGGFTGLLAVGGDVLDFISTFLSGEKVNLLRGWKIMFREHCLEHYLDASLNYFVELTELDAILPERPNDETVVDYYIIHHALREMETPASWVYIAMEDLDDVTVGKERSFELLQRCDRNALFGVVTGLCDMFQGHYLQHLLEEPEDNDGTLNSEDVKTVIRAELLKMRVAEKCQQDKDLNAFTVVSGAGVAAAKLNFQMAESGGRERSSTGLLIVGNDVLSLISTFLSWEKVTLLREWTAKADGNSSSSCCISPCSSMVITSSGSDLHLWDAASGRLKKTFKGHTDLVRSCRFFPNGKTVVSTSNDGTLKVWDVVLGSLVRTMRQIEGHTCFVTCVDVSPDNARVLSISVDGTWKIWHFRVNQYSFARWKLQHTGQTNGDSFCCSFSPSGRLCLVGCSGGLNLHDSTTYQLQRTFTGHGDEVSSCSFSPDGATILSGSYDYHTMKLWSTTTGQCLRTLRGHSGGVFSCAFSPSGHSICSASDDGTLVMWAAATGQIERIIDADACSPPVLCQVSFCASSDGMYILSVIDVAPTMRERGTENGIVKMWHLRCGGSVK